MKEICRGLGFPEGPVAMPDGSVILVEIQAGTLTRCKPDGTKEVVADCGGGPNGAALGPDGRMYVCNNGGFVGGRTARSCAAATTFPTATPAGASRRSTSRPGRSRRFIPNAMVSG